MKKWNFWALVLTLPFGSTAFAQDAMDILYDRFKADSQESYDYSMSQLYVTTPYTSQDYERDLLYLYTKNQLIKKASELCAIKLKNGGDSRHAYRLWEAENKTYVLLIDSLWKKLVNGVEANKKQFLQYQVDANLTEYFNLFKDDGNASVMCHRNYISLVDSNNKARKAEDEIRSNQYHSINFYFHPEQKKKLLEKLDAHFATSLRTKEACEQAGSEWRAVGMKQSMRCITKYPDAGKSCTDSSQCKGGCMDVTPYNHKGAPIGKCKVDNDKFGCFSYLVKGERGGSRMCID